MQGQRWTGWGPITVTVLGHDRRDTRTNASGAADALGRVFDCLSVAVAVTDNPKDSPPCPVRQSGPSSRHEWDPSRVTGLASAFRLAAYPTPWVQACSNRSLERSEALSGII